VSETTVMHLSEKGIRRSSMDHARSTEWTAEGNLQAVGAAGGGGARKGCCDIWLRLQRREAEQRAIN